MLPLMLPAKPLASDSDGEKSTLEVEGVRQSSSCPLGMNHLTVANWHPEGTNVTLEPSVVNSHSRKLRESPSTHSFSLHQVYSLSCE